MSTMQEKSNVNFFDSQPVESAESVMVNMRFSKNYPEKSARKRFLFFSGGFLTKENACCEVGGGGSVRV